MIVVAPEIPARAVWEARASHLRPADFSSLEDTVTIANDRSDGLAAAVLDPRPRAPRTRSLGRCAPEACK